MAKQFIAGISLATVVLIAMPVFARAQGENAGAQNANIGQQLYESHCAVCHGADAQGNGPLASILKRKVPNLTLLQKNNHGVFPVQRVYEIIDGTKPIEGHGTPDMPAWGVEFMKEAPPFGGPVAKEEYVTAQILALIGYLAGIQAK